MKSVELIPGGYGPLYGRGLGGLVTVALAPARRARVSTAASAADTIDASASVRAKVSDTRPRRRRGAQELPRQRPLRRHVRGRRSSSSRSPRTGTARRASSTTSRPTRRSRSAGSISSDRTTRTLAQPEPVAHDAADDRHRLRPGLPPVREAPRRRLDRRRSCRSFGTDTDVPREPVRLHAHGASPTTRGIYGLRADWRGPRREVPPRERRRGRRDAGRVNLHRVGLHRRAAARGRHLRLRRSRRPRRSTSDDWKTVIATVAPYVEGRLLAPRRHACTWCPGPASSRTSRRPTRSSRPRPAPRTSASRSEEPVIEPRISVALRVHARGSRPRPRSASTTRRPQAEDLSAVFGTPTLVPLDGAALPGRRHLPAHRVAVGRGDGLLLDARDDLVVRSAGREPARSAHALDQTGIGRSLRHPVLLRQQQLGRFFGWVSYSILRSERRDAPEPRLAPLRLRPDPRLHGARVVRPRRGLRGRRPLPVRDGLPATPGHGKLLRLWHATLTSRSSACTTRSGSRPSSRSTCASPSASRSRRPTPRCTSTCRT